MSFPTWRLDLDRFHVLFHQRIFSDLVFIFCDAKVSLSLWEWETSSGGACSELGKIKVNNEFTRTSRARHGGRRIRSLNDPIEPNNLTQSNLTSFVWGELWLLSKAQNTMFARNFGPMPPELVSEGLNYLRSPQYSPLNDLKALEEVDPQFPDTDFLDFGCLSPQTWTWLTMIPGEHTCTPQTFL